MGGRKVEDLRQQVGEGGEVGRHPTMKVDWDPVYHYRACFPWRSTIPRNHPFLWKLKKIVLRFLNTNVHPFHDVPDKENGG